MRKAVTEHAPVLISTSSIDETKWTALQETWSLENLSARFGGAKVEILDTAPLRAQFAFAQLSGNGIATFNETLLLDLLAFEEDSQP